MPRDTGLELDTLDALAQKAWHLFPGPTQGSRRRDYLRERMYNELTWEMIHRYQRQAIALAMGQLLNQAEKDSKDAAKAVPRLSPTGLDIPSKAAGRPDESSESASASSPPKPSTVAPTALDLKRLADLHAAAAKVRLEVAIHLSSLDTVMVDGKRIGDCTASEVRLWAERRKVDERCARRDWRFALNLAASGIPGGEIIRDWVKPEDADALYARAESVE